MQSTIISDGERLGAQRAPEKRPPPVLEANSQTGHHPLRMRQASAAPGFAGLFLLELYHGRDGDSSRGEAPLVWNRQRP